jgi:hypothetical protein
MWTTLVLAASLSTAPHDVGALTLTNVRATYGPHGIARGDNKLLPGDHLFLSFEIEGITLDPNGKALYSMATEVSDSKNKMLFKQDPRDLEAVGTLGGGILPAFAQIDTPLTQSAGDYTVKVTVTDRANKKSQTLSQVFQVQPAGFGIARLTTTTDPEGRFARSVFGVGDTLWLNYSLVGFARDKTSTQPDLTVECRVLDDKGQPTMAKPFEGAINKDLPSNSPGAPVQFQLSLNRTGKFTVELTATDKIAKKTATLKFPLTVYSSK